MKIGNRFRTDLIFYQLGVIVPGISNFAVIYVLKRFLGSENFGFFSLRFALIYLLSAIAVGWLTQSIVRLLAAENDSKTPLLKSILIIGLGVLLCIGLISSSILVFYFKDQFAWGGLMLLALISSGLYAIMLSFSQANFKPKLVLLSEILRTVFYFLLSFISVYYFAAYAISFLWTSLIISNCAGVMLLIYKNDLTLSELIRLNIFPYFKTHLKQLIKYGGPLSIWFIIWNCMHYIEKPVLMTFTQNYEVIGNYQALFDILSKGSNLLLLPVSYAIFPHLTLAFEQNNPQRAQTLLKKVITAELFILIIILLMYGIFGFKILADVFKIPHTNDYYYAGFIMVTNAIIWQMAVIIHKPLELGKFTLTMLHAMMLAFIIYIICLFTLPKMLNLSLLSFALPALIAALTYITYTSIKINRLHIWQ